MITKKPYGVSPDISLKIGYVDVDYYTVFEMKLVLEESKHDMLVLRLAGIPPKAITDYYGKAVTLSVSTGPYYEYSFYGYVAEVRPHAVSAAGLMNKSMFQEAEIVCVGASYAMRSDRSRVWSGYSLTSIAKEMAERYSFSLDVPTLPVVHDTLAQTDESDWKFLTRYAKSLGYAVNVHGTHMHIYDPYNAVSRGISTTRLMTLQGSKGYHKEHPGQILEFNGNFGRRHSDGQYIDTIVTVFSDDNQTYDYSTRSLLGDGTTAPDYTERVHDHLHSLTQAMYGVEQHRRADYDYYADAKVIGSVDCRPGGVVDVQKFFGEFDGLWYVKAVEHTITKDNFVTHLDLARNINSQLDFTNVPRIGPVPDPIYQRGNWIASKNMVREYV